MIAYMFQKYPEDFQFQLFLILPWKLLFSKKWLLFNSFSCLFCRNKTLRLNNLKTTTVIMKVKISVFGICVEGTIYFLLHNLHNRTFQYARDFFYCFYLLLDTRASGIVLWIWLRPFVRSQRKSRLASFFWFFCMKLGQGRFLKKVPSIQEA